MHVLKHRDVKVDVVPRADSLTLISEGGTTKRAIDKLRYCCFKRGSDTGYLALTNPSRYFQR